MPLTILNPPPPRPRADRPPALAFVALPYYQTLPGECLGNTDHPVEPPDECIICRHGEAFVQRSFSNCWVQALNSRGVNPWTHFAMIHVDVDPQPRTWLSDLIDEMHRTGADLLSVVLPIKTAHGLTSTAILDPRTGAYKRLTMREVMAIPEPTFDAAAAGYPGCQLLTSTGLWVARFDRPWAEEVYFDCTCRVRRDPADGKFKVDFFPEDWHFARMLHARGAKVLATKTVPALHWGSTPFPNNVAWGSVPAEGWRADGGAWLKDPPPGGEGGHADPRAATPYETAGLAPQLSPTL